MDKRDKLYELHGLFNRARGTLLTKHQLLSEPPRVCRRLYTLRG